MSEPRDPIVDFGQDGSDVYLFEAPDDSLVCAACALGESSYRTANSSEMLTHLSDHLTGGDTVPDWVLESLGLDHEQVVALHPRRHLAWRRAQ